MEECPPLLSKDYNLGVSAGNRCIIHLGCHRVNLHQWLGIRTDGQGMAKAAARLASNIGWFLQGRRTGTLAWGGII